MAVIEFANMETQQALARFSPYYSQPTQTQPQKLPTLPAKIAYQKVANGKAVLTLITRE